MIISSSSIGMESARSYSSLRMDAYNSTGTGNSLTINNENNTDKARPATVNLANSSFKNSMDNLMKRYESMKTSGISYNRFEQDAISRIKTECINYLIRLLFGEEVDADDVGSNKSSDNSSQGSSNNQALVINLPAFQSNNSLSVTNTHYFSESEEVSFKTKGTVVTADGREIDFGLSFQMSREFEDYYEENYDIDLSSVLCDPLVINLDVPCAGVSDQKFMFDIDSDGIKDSISSLNKGSGFLALDKNGDGKINDGNELFGTSSGDGFKDLSAYDSDGNGWIDEADEIWDKLLIYSVNPDGSSELYGLSDKGVGAIFLGNVSSDYSLNNQENNEVNAVIRKTGIFLYENGNVGTIQHLDLAK